jgi:putative ABC transport system permease protein
MLRIYFIIKAAFKSLLKNRTRSLLTSLGIIIGVSAVIVMVAIGQGSQQMIAQSIDALGSNLIIVYPGVSRSGGVSRGAGSFNHFTLDDVQKLQKEATLINEISPIVRSGGQIIGGQGNWFTAVYGVSTDYFSIRSMQLESGEFFTERDIRARKKIALLGKTVANNLFPNQDPSGAKIRIRNVPFTVIGVLKAKGQSATGTDQDDMILAPYTTVLYRLRGHGRDDVDMITASAINKEKITTAEEEIRQIIRESHRLEAGQDDDFTIRDQAEITEAATQTSRVMTLLLGSIAAVSLVVGGIGIMNIMLVSVTERTREIGIRMSVGARSRDILSQFLTEATVLSLAGGLIGILFSFGISYVLNHFTQISALIQLPVVMVAVLFSGVVGIFFGFYPARKAAALNPIDALRYE